MTKQQLIEKVAAKTELGKAQVEVAVDAVLDLIGEALQSNERVDLRGFGSFVVKDKKERQGRNPRTGETITIAAKRDASFRPGKELTEKLAHTTTPPSAEVALMMRSERLRVTANAEHRIGMTVDAGGATWLK